MISVHRRVPAGHVPHGRRRGERALLELVAGDPAVHGAEPLGPGQGQLPQALELLPDQGAGQGIQG